jgi:4-hydroxy-4-methyl-2-oxoglutarate aldolase
MTDFVKLFTKEYSTPLLADSAYRLNIEPKIAPAEISPLQSLMKIAGPILTVEANNDLVSILGAVHQACPGDVIVIANRTRGVALIGDLIAVEARRKGLAGFIVDASVRDRAMLMELAVPVFSRGFYPVGPLKLPRELKGIGQIGGSVSIGSAKVDAGDWAFADADGVLVFKPGSLPAVFERAAVDLQREKDLFAQISAGNPLGDLFKIDEFMAKRALNTGVDFNQHLSELGMAI